MRGTHLVSLTKSNDENLENFQTLLDFKRRFVLAEEQRQLFLYLQKFPERLVGFAQLDIAVLLNLLL